MSIKNNTKPPNREITTNLKKHLWRSIVIILIFYILVEYLITLIYNPIYQLFLLNYDESLYQLTFFLFLLITNLIFGLFIIGFVPKILGLQLNKHSISQFLEKIGLGWLRSISKEILLGIIAVILIFFFNYFFNIVYFLILSPEYPYYPNYFNYIILEKVFLLEISFWREVTFRGIFLSILTKKYRREVVIFLNSFIYLFYFYIKFLIYINFQMFSIFQLIIVSFLIFFYALINSYLFFKTNSLIPGIVLNTGLILTNSILTYMIILWFKILVEA